MQGHGHVIDRTTVSEMGRCCDMDVNDEKYERAYERASVRTSERAGCEKGNASEGCEMAQNDKR